MRGLQRGCGAHGGRKGCRAQGARARRAPAGPCPGVLERCFHFFLNLSRNQEEEEKEEVQGGPQVHP